jgi:sirohydrochlorin ferrochelatase
MAAPATRTATRRVIVVAHGSRSARWVESMNAFAAGLRNHLGSLEAQVEFTFLELSPPLLADRLKSWRERDEPGLIGILPFFMTHSGHAGDDIPEIADQILGQGRWYLFEPAGRVEVFAANVRRRLEAYGAVPGDPVIISGYGASHHDDVWRKLVDELQEFSGPFAGDEPWLWAPSGHFLEDCAEPLRAALRSVAERGLRRAVVMPLYLAVSSYQESLIPSVIAEFPGLEVLFQPDSILPDAQLERWAAERIAEILTPRS